MFVRPPALVRPPAATPATPEVDLTPTELQSRIEALDNAISKVNQTMTISQALQRRTVAMQCSEFINNLQLLLEAAERRDEALSGLVGEIIFSAVRPCQASQLTTLQQISQELQDIRDSLEMELMLVTSTPSSVPDEIEVLKNEVDAIEDVFEKIEDIIGGVSVRASGIQSKCSDFLAKVRQFSAAIR